MRRALHGHLWTLRPQILDRLRPTPAPEDAPWSTTFADPDRRLVTLRGRIHAPAKARALLLIVHGMGGSIESRYMRLAARAAEAQGLAYLRLNLRGAEREGEGIYHAGLIEDVEVALASPELARFPEILLLGYSLGGHMLLRYAAHPAPDPRIRALATVCSPLDLARGVREIRRPAGRIYEAHVLEGLKEIYEGVARRHGPLLPAGAIDRVRSIYEWDAQVVAPLYGYRNADHYYRDNSAGPRLGEVRLRTLLLAAEADPMVLEGQILPWLDEASPSIRVAWSGRGGHVGFPEDVDLGLDLASRGPRGNVHDQVVRWLRASLEAP